ncbi:MAG: hypothetical protein NTX50_02455 [Candidatus Sumerlaeota bacterium]|nr:hypothetical protein [Candidatus Sumerlaeota bacterium]
MIPAAENQNPDPTPEKRPADRPKSRAWRNTGVWVAAAAMILCAVYVVGFQRRYVKTLKTLRPYQGVLYSAKDGERLIPLSVGYRLPLSDFLFMRSIQAFGGMFRGVRNYQSLFNLFFVITDLDPKYIDVYKFGNLVMGDEGGQQEQGIELLDKGMILNRDKYRLPYEAMYCLMYQMAETDRNRQRALFYIKMAMKSKDAPDWLPRQLPDILAKKGKYHQAIRYGLQGYLEALDQRQPVLIGVYYRRLLSTIHNWQLDSLLKEAIAFKKAHGRDIASVRELFEANPPFEYETLDMLRVRQIVMNYEANGKKLTPDLEKIFQLCTNVTHEQPYDARILDDPLRLNDRPPYMVMFGYNSGDRFNFIQSEEDVMGYLERYLPQMRAKLQEYWKREKKLPVRFEDVLPPGSVVMREPFGGKWIYEPGLMTGKMDTWNRAIFRSSMHPDK